MDITTLPVIESRQFMGGRVVSLEDDGGIASIRFNPPRGMINPHGTVQGGFVAAMIDDVVSMATHFAGGMRPFVTTSLTCYYLRPVPATVPILVTSKLIKAGRTQAIFDAEVTIEGDDRILIRATQVQQFME